MYPCHLIFTIWLSAITVAFFQPLLRPVPVQGGALAGQSPGWAHPGGAGCLRTDEAMEPSSCSILRER